MEKELDWRLGPGAGSALIGCVTLSKPFHFSGFLPRCADQISDSRVFFSIYDYLGLPLPWAPLGPPQEL